MPRTKGPSPEQTICACGKCGQPLQADAKPCTYPGESCKM